MAITKNTGLIERLTEKALNGKTVSMGDVVEVAKLLDANSNMTANAINRLDRRIDNLQQKHKIVETIELKENKICFLGMVTSTKH